jgi:hypothetical protein
MMQSQWAEMVEIISKWNAGSDKEIKAFHKKHKKGYELVKKFVVVELT